MDELTGKVLGKGAEVAGKLAKPFLDRVAGPALDELGQHFADKVRMYRYGNHLKMVARAREMAEEAGFSPVEIPLKTLFPLLEYGSLEDDEDMQERWAALLANAANPQSRIKPDPAFVNVLSQLMAQEVKILDNLYDRKPRILSIPILEQEYGVRHTAGIMLSKLTGLGIIAPDVSSLEPGRVSHDFRQDLFVALNNEHALTAFGAAFIAACRRPVASKAENSLPR